MLQLLALNVSVAAIDATGFTSSYTSCYYSRRTGEASKELLRTSISVDTSKKIISGWEISQKTDHEIKHTNALIRQSNKMRKSDCYVMDKGSDSEKIHPIIREEIKANSIIPVRERKRKKIRGKYRKQLNLVFDRIKYNQRNIVETIFSVVKRKLGETLRARKFRYQVKEIKIKLIICNINKKVVEVIGIKLRISTERLIAKRFPNLFGSLGFMMLSVKNRYFLPNILGKFAMKRAYERIGLKICLLFLSLRHIIFMGGKTA